VEHVAERVGPWSLSRRKGVLMVSKPRWAVGASDGAMPPSQVIFSVPASMCAMVLPAEGMESMCSQPRSPLNEPFHLIAAVGLGDIT